MVGPREALSVTSFNIKEINWLGDKPFESQKYWPLKIKIRSTQEYQEAKVKPLSKTKALIELQTPEEGVSKGQACVFYDKNTTRVFGGGWIT